MNDHDYTLVQSDSAPGLERQVRGRLKTGWRPRGGVAVQHVKPRQPKMIEAWFYQAMTK